MLTDSPQNQLRAGLGASLGQRGPPGQRSGTGDARGSGVWVVVGQAGDGCGGTASGEVLPGPVLTAGTLLSLRGRGPDPGDSDLTGKTIYT